MICSKVSLVRNFKAGSTVQERGVVGFGGGGGVGRECEGRNTRQGLQ